MLYLCFLVILLQKYFDVFTVEQVDCVVNFEQFIAAKLHNPRGNISESGKESHREGADMEPRYIKYSLAVWSCLVSCHFYFSSFASRFIVGENMVLENSKVLRQGMDPKGNEPVTLSGQINIMENKDTFEGWIKEDDIWLERLKKFWNTG